VKLLLGTFDLIWVMVVYIEICAHGKYRVSRQYSAGSRSVSGISSRRVRIFCFWQEGRVQNEKVKLSISLIIDSVCSDSVEDRGAVDGQDWLEDPRNRVRGYRSLLQGQRSVKVRSNEFARIAPRTAVVEIEATDQWFANVSSVRDCQCDLLPGLLIT